MTIYFLSKITNQGAEYKQDAGDDVCLDGCEPLGLGDVGGDGVEDIDQHQEYRDEQRHPEIFLWYLMEYNNSIWENISRI